MAGIDLSAMVAEAVQGMIKDSVDEQLTSIMSLRDQLVSTRDTLAMYHETNESAALKQKKSIWAKNANIIANVIQSRNNSNGENLVKTLRGQQQISGNTKQDQQNYLQAMKKGYYLLNSIGEQVRQEGDITYTLVIRSPNNESAIRWDGLTINDILGGYNINTGLFGDSDFVTIYTHSSNGWSNNEKGRLGCILTLKNSKGIWKKAQKNMGTNKNIKKLSSKHFSLLKLLDKEQGNRGHSAEALIDIVENEKSMSSENLVAIMTEVRRNNKAYWKGGDVGTIQVKSNGASFTNVSQLVYRLDQVISIFDKAIMSSATANNMQKAQQAIQSANVDTDKIISDSVQELLQSMFT